MVAPSLVLEVPHDDRDAETVAGLRCAHGGLTLYVPDGAKCLT